MKLIHSLYIEDAEFEQLQKHKHTNFTNNSTDWFNYEQDYYSIENPSERLELFLALKGYEYDVEMNSKGWQSQVERAMKNA